MLVVKLEQELVLGAPAALAVVRGWEIHLQLERCKDTALSVYLRPASICQ